MPTLRIMFHDHGGNKRLEGSYADLLTAILAKSDVILLRDDHAALETSIANRTAEQARITREGKNDPQKDATHAHRIVQERTLQGCITTRIAALEGQRAADLNARTKAAIPHLEIQKSQGGGPASWPKPSGPKPPETS